MLGNDRTGAVVAVLGLGEAGSLLARDLVRGGAAVRGWDPDPHGDLDEIPLARSFAEAVSGAAIVISVNWATVALDVACEAAGLIAPNTMYADHNTGGPVLKEDCARVIRAVGARFVDVAMMAPVPGLGMRVPMLLSGIGADELAAVYRSFGTSAEVVGAAPGIAAARKLTRSVFFKGMSAAVCEALEAARAAGVEPWLRSDIARTFAGADETLLDRIVDGTHKHAGRRAHEMHAAVELLRELGVPSPIAAAAATSLERLSQRQGAPVLQ